MDVDSEVEPLLQEMSERLSVVRAELLPSLRQLDEDALLSHYTVDEQARLYLSAAFALALSLYSLDKVTKHQVVPGKGTSSGAAPKPSGASTRGGRAATAMEGSSPSAAFTDAQLVYKIERITDYIKKLQELATLERQRRNAVAAPTTAAKAVAQDATAAPQTLDAVSTELATAAAVRGARGTKRVREVETSDTISAIPTGASSKKIKEEAVSQEHPPPPEAVVAGESGTSSGPEADDYGDAQMFSVISRVAGETGTLVSRLLKQVMSSTADTSACDA